MFETRDIFVYEKGVKHYPLFATAFINEIKKDIQLEIDFGEIQIINLKFNREL